MMAMTMILEKVIDDDESAKNEKTVTVTNFMKSKITRTNMVRETMTKIMMTIITWLITMTATVMRKVR